ncbi:zona pellucida sperm-binding protein 4-like isoform X3 [Anguilla anguilla]|uniref:zona pellucida sperm-binding protein 4-like isoform X3 n=1 Tax=Anguilla anguilla TaxID=7936 RepID=UPI0015A9DA46|nr:zona pellucida sperm-binding protein 4-like isoform X3 [Anguilla anguilla]
MRLVVCAMLVFLAQGVQSGDFALRSQDAKPSVTCTSRHIHAQFGLAVQNNLQVKDDEFRIPVHDTKEKCGVKSVQEEDGQLSFYSLYDSCYSHIEGDSVLVALEVQVGKEGPWYRVNISCPLSQYKAPDLKPCSLDGNFVFSVNTSDFQLPIALSSLRVKGQPQCTPVATSTDQAVFKFGVTECGAKRVVLGKVVRYEVEVEALPLVLTEARDSPFRLQVRCLYAGSVRLQTSLLSKDPTKPPLVSAVGTPKVRMRIARDGSFSSFVPEDELPLELSLRTPVHVEVSFARPSQNPGDSLRLRDCFAFPASRHSLWTLLHNGCPNPLDSERSSVLLGRWGQSLSQVRRFDVKTFAFIDPKTGEPSMEELYFYCWVEICTEEEECEQQCPTLCECLILTHGSGRMRREYKSDRVSQLVFFGPVLLGQNSSGWEEIHGPEIAVPAAIVYQMLSVCSLSVTCASALFLLLFCVWSKARESRQSRRSHGEPGIGTETEVAASVIG